MWGKIKNKLNNIRVYIKDKRNRFYLIICVILLILLGLEILLLRNNIISFFKSQTNWVSAVTILEIIILIILWLKFSKFKKIFGEGKGGKRSRLHFTLIYILIFIFLLPFTFLYIDGFQIQPDKIPLTTQLGIIAISFGLAGITLSASRIPYIKPQNRQELMCVSQKFIMVAILFIFFAAAINLIDKGLNGIDVNTFSISNLVNLVDWYRGILFYISVPSFYGSIFLILVGFVDLVFVFADLDTRPTVPS